MCPFYDRMENFFGHKALSRAASGNQIVFGSLTAHLIHRHRLGHKQLQRATQRSQFLFFITPHILPNDAGQVAGAVAESMLFEDAAAGGGGDGLAFAVMGEQIGIAFDGFIS